MRRAVNLWPWLSATAAERAERSIAARLSLLPALVGLFVGVLYTVGAVLTTGQLRRANLVVRDTLPLVPLAQLLGRGMSVFLQAVVRVRRSYTGGLLSTPKNRERRDVDLISDVVELLSGWRRDTRNTLPNDSLVFLAPTATPF